MKNKILSVTQIKIKLNSEREIELSSDEARRVYQELKDLFFNSERADTEEIFKKLNTEKEYIPYPVPCPIYIDRWPEPYKPYWGYEITCGGNSAGYSPTTNNGILSINLNNQQ